MDRAVFFPPEIAKSFVPHGEMVIHGPRYLCSGSSKIEERKHEDRYGADELHRFSLVFRSAGKFRYCSTNVNNNFRGGRELSKSAREDFLPLLDDASGLVSALSQK